MMGEIINPYPYYLVVQYDYSVHKYFVRVINDPRYDPDNRIYFYDLSLTNAWMQNYMPPTVDGEPPVNGEVVPVFPVLFFLVVLVVVVVVFGGKL